MLCCVKNIELIREENLRQIEEHMLAIIQLAKGCNITKDEIIAIQKLLQRSVTFNECFGN